MREEVFQVHVATPPMPDKRQACSSFPSGMQEGLLSLLVLHRVFYHCWCFTWSFYPAGASQISYFKILLWQPNKMVTDHKTYKLGRQSSNDHNCQIWFTSLHMLWRKCNLTISYYKPMGSFSCHSTKPKGRSP